MKICVFVYLDDSELLKDCLIALNKQTYHNFDTIVIIKGKSELNCEQSLLTELNILQLKDICDDREGSYQQAFQYAIDNNYDWIWCLCDGVIPNEDVLEKFVEKSTVSEKCGYLTNLIKPYNSLSVITPNLSTFVVNNREKWAEHIELGLLRINNASFISSFIKVDAIKNVGLPRESYLKKRISDYFSKISKEYGAGYLIVDSIVALPQRTVLLPTTNISQIKNKICALVVTYNRKELLQECIDALNRQTFKEFDIIIVDNASTDGTYDAIKDRLSQTCRYFNTGANLGGSGGFYYGMKKAYEEGYEWIWIMDDDVVPTVDALQELINSSKQVKSASFFASAVYSQKGTAMNTPEISNYSTNGYKYWYAYLDKGLVRLAHATFVSLLINRKAISRCGLPCKDYFIWGDDTEYTMRLIGKYGAAYMVGKSKVVHNRAIVSTLSIHNESNPKRIKMYYYMVRNTLLNAKTYFGKESFKRFLKRYLKDCITILKSKQAYRRLKIKTILSAIWDFSNKKYNVEAFNNRYDLYGQERLLLNIVTNKDEELIQEDAYSTIRYTKGYYIFEDNPHLDSYIESIVSADTVVPKQDFMPLSSNEKIVLDIESLIRNVSIVTYENNTYFFTSDAHFISDSSCDVPYLIKQENPGKMDWTVIEKKLDYFLDKVTNKYAVDKIILIKPEGKSMSAIYNYISSKLPGSVKINRLNEIE